TGGPFGAAIFNSDTHELLAPGVNMVVPGKCSVLHAEMVAIMIAQQEADTHDLGGEGMPSYELVSSTEPCAMCMGAVPWAGLRKLVCGARGDDACAIGMDEGEKPTNWVETFESRGISVSLDVCRDEAAAVLQNYVAKGGLIYNGRRES
ncbi:nucleoside deaminase, partial [PVC group bacterium]|nr:nucleoside deaminase [PVC group bacterium]